MGKMCTDGPGSSIKDTINMVLVSRYKIGKNVERTNLVARCCQHFGGHLCYRKWIWGGIKPVVFGFYLITITFIGFCVNEVRYVRGRVVGGVER